MIKKSSRRDCIERIGGDSLIVGFNLQTQSWATESDLLNSSPDVFANNFPVFDGELITDEISLSEAANDFGHIHRNASRVILKPATYQDIINMIQFANQHNVAVAVKGQGYSTYGETQSQSGVVIDMVSLADVSDVSNQHVVTQAGARWIDLLSKTVPHNLRLPIAPDFVNLSVGSTVAVGGLGAQSHKHGCVANNISHLKVITGDGRLRTCSAHQNSMLFHSMKGGLGQLGIIVEAGFELSPTPGQVRIYQLVYDDLAHYLDDNQRLLDQGIFDGIQGGAESDSTGNWRYVMQLAKYFEPGLPPVDAELLDGLNFVLGEEVIQDLTYFAFLNRLTPFTEQLKVAEHWTLPPPWCPLLLPASKAQVLIQDALASTPPNDVTGPVLISMHQRDAFSSLFFSVPEEEKFVYFSLIRTVTSPTPERVEKLTQTTSNIYTGTRASGGFQYPVGTIPINTRNWKKYYHKKWFLLKLLKNWFDPNNLPGPMRGILKR